jgi:hypothetical protein
VRSLVIAVCYGSAVLMWGITAIGSWHVRRMYRAAGAPPAWYASVHAPGWWHASRLCLAFSIFACLPLFIVDSWWGFPVFGGWFVVMIAFVLATHAFDQGSEGAGG